MKEEKRIEENRKQRNESIFQIMCFLTGLMFLINSDENTILKKIAICIYAWNAIREIIKFEPK